MRWYFTAVAIGMLLLGLIIYKYEGSLLLIIITAIIGVLNLLAAFFYTAINGIYEEADKINDDLL